MYLRLFCLHRVGPILTNFTTLAYVASSPGKAKLRTKTIYKESICDKTTLERLKERNYQSFRCGDVQHLKNLYLNPFKVCGDPISERDITRCNNKDDNEIPIEYSASYVLHRYVPIIY